MKRYVEVEAGTVGGDDDEGFDAEDCRGSEECSGFQHEHYTNNALNPLESSQVHDRQNGKTIPFLFSSNYLLFTICSTNKRYWSARWRITIRGQVVSSFVVR